MKTLIADLLVSVSIHYRRCEHVRHIEDVMSAWREDEADVLWHSDRYSDMARCERLNDKDLLNAIIDTGEWQPASEWIEWEIEDLISDYKKRPIMVKHHFHRLYRKYFAKHEVSYYEIAYIIGRSI